MKILFVWSAAEWSIYDVARGYRNALAAQGHEIRDFRLYNRIKYHGTALGEKSKNIELLARVATEGIATDVLYFNPDLVVIASGLSFHPNGLWLLRKLGVSTVTIFTESPYDDDKQHDFAKTYPEAVYFTSERTSARKYGWYYLSHAYDPAVHYPRDSSVEPACDVLVLGTGWGDRQKFLERVDWNGIDLRILGPWPGMTDDSPLARYHTSGCIDNDLVPDFYASAKIVINHHREHATAESMNPRTLELAACEAFQLSNYRREVEEVFRGAVPMYNTPNELDIMIRRYLADDGARACLAAESRAQARLLTFEVQARELVTKIATHNESPKQRSA